jgi:hypothetical protein
MRHYPYIYIYIYNNVSAATNEQERTTLITNRPYIYIFIKQKKMMTEKRLPICFAPPS